MKKMATGNQAVAYAVKESDVEVVAAYPITPQTEVVETIASMVETGKMRRIVYPRGKRALGAGRVHRRFSIGCESIHRHVESWLTVYA